MGHNKNTSGGFEQEMGNFAREGLAPSETELIGEEENHRELLHLQTRVDPDGAAAVVTLHTRLGKIDLAVSIDQITAASAEIDRAGSLMLSRQMQGLDRGRSAFTTLKRTAPKAAQIIPTVCRETGDVIVMYRFADRLPMPIRIALDQFFAVRKALDVELKLLSH